MAIELQPEATDNRTTPTKPSLNGLWVSKIKAKDRMFFIEQLSLMLETGIDLHTSLHTLAQQNDNSKLAAIINVMAEDIGQGNPFSVAMAKHPSLFSSTYVSLVNASENGGYLQRILQHLLEMEKQQENLRNSLIAAASYPMFLVFFSISVVLFILAVVFPKFAELFSSIQNQLPFTTIVLMAMSDAIIAYWWLLAPGFGAMVFSWIAWLNSASGKHNMDRIKLKTPLLNKIYIQLYLIQTMRVLGLSLHHGVNLLEALKIARGVVNNHVYQTFIDQLVSHVTEGRKLALGFHESTFIPPVVKQMITTGEDSGQLSMVCTRLAEYFQQDLEKKLKLLTKAIEPLMLVFMGLVVGLIVSSLILPIFKLSHAVH